MTTRRPSLALRLGFALAVCSLVTHGCGGGAAKKDDQSVVPRVPPPPPRAVQSVQPELENKPEQPTPPPAPVRHIGPWLEWQIAGADQVTGKSFLKLVVLPGSGGVLELTSYDIPSHQEFPALYVRVMNQSNTVTELVNQKLSAQLYIQVEADGNLIHNLPSQPVDIVVTEIEGKYVRGTFEGPVHDVDSTGNAWISGKFQTVVEKPEAAELPKASTAAQSRAPSATSPSGTGQPQSPVALSSIAVPSAAAGPQFRVANQNLNDQAKGLSEKVRQTTERLSAKANKPDELKGKTDSLRKEVVEAYRVLHQIAPIGDELLLRGEREGEQIKKQAEALKGPLDDAVDGLRSSLGSPTGLVNAATHRAKAQLGPLKELDKLIEQQKWSLAYEKLQNLLETADDVGRFVEPKDAEPLYNPIFDRAAQVMPHRLEEQKTKIIPALREEYATVRPDLGELKDKFAGVLHGLKENKEIRWNDRVLPGPACLLEVAEAWQQMDRSVVGATAVLHAVGPLAETELKVLQAEYDLARTQAVLLVKELIMGETAALSGSEAESRYFGYLDAIPRLMSAVHDSPDRFLSLATHLSDLAARSPGLPDRIARYRAATDEALRWRRRLAGRYVQRMHLDKPPAERLGTLLDAPPPRPGQAGPGGLKRVNQMFWSSRHSPEYVASAWTQDWRDFAAIVESLRVQWRTGSDPVLIAPWHRLARAESQFSRQTLVGLSEALAKEFLSTPDRPPLTLEAALALHTATHGPYLELGGTINAVSLVNLPDRLWDQRDPFDMPGPLVAGTLIPYPNYPALVQLQIKPRWLAHELFVWTSEPPPPPVSPPAPPAKPAPIAAETQKSATPSDPPASSTTGPAVQPSAVGPTGAAGRTPAGVAAAPQSPATPPVKKAEPAKPKGPVPKGGVAF